jgi:valyl-tRNA synthetase
MDLPKDFDPKTAEPKWQRFWEEKGVFRFDPESKKPIFSVDTPPPTVSGKMHIGHAFSYSQQDFLVRYKRMRGFSVFYPFGTDDNGLPTERLIEKTKGVKATHMDRQEFVKLCLNTLKNELRPQYIADWKRIGMSCDWDIFYTTINEHCQRISQKSFIDLYKMGREYRKVGPVVWCPECQTAIAQVEMEDKEKESSFNDVVFKLDDGKDLIIATTRPELLPACVAIFAHPDDRRYKHLFGKKAKVPLFDLHVEIKASPRADPEKGTGILMCCTFGDTDDAEHYKEFNLPLRIAIGKDGRMTEIAGKYKNMKSAEARKAIIEDLKSHGLLKSQKQIKHVVNVHDKCGTEIEIQETKQWFIKYLDLKNKFLEAGKQMKWYPDHMINRYTNWVNGLQWDWCISRQRYFGVPLPVWYCAKCDEIILADENRLPVDPLKDKPPVHKCPKCGHHEFIGEKDVMDTWATSSLTPFLAIELFRDKPVYKKLFPMSLRPQAHDIITFWLFNTVVKSQLHHGKNPWENIAISGWTLDPHGKKMSKSKGNMIEPQAVIEKYSADCVRFWAAGSKLGEDMPYQEKDLVTGRKFVTKLWNASKFCIMNIEHAPEKKPQLEIIDRWMLAKLNAVVKSCTGAFDQYEYSRAKAEAENFFWHTFCDYYLEMVKDRLYNPDKYGKHVTDSAKYTLYHSLLSILKMMAPITPYITEEIYHLYFAKKEGFDSIHISPWPLAGVEDKEAEKLGDIAADVIAAIRKYKSEKGLSLAEPLGRVVVNSKDAEQVFDVIKATMKAGEIVHGKADQLKTEGFGIGLNIEQ